MQWENEIREIFKSYGITEESIFRLGDIVADLTDLIDRISTAEVESALAQDEEKRWAQEPKPVSTGRHTPEYIESLQTRCGHVSVREGNCDIADCWNSIDRAEWDAVNTRMLRYAVG